MVSLWDVDVGCRSCLLPSLTICTADSFPTDETEMNIRNSFIPHKYGITSVFLIQVIVLKWHKNTCKDADVIKKPLCWGDSSCSKYSYRSVHQFLCSALLKPPLWKSYPKGMNGCSFKFCSIWCGCKYWLFYGNEFVWLVYSRTVYLDLTVDVCMLQNHCQELREVLE